MLRWLATADRLTSASRPAWGWLGELSLVILGVHLAADRLDDAIFAMVAPLQLPWPSPDFPLLCATWIAIAVELHVDLWAAFTLFRSRSEPANTPREWFDRASVGSVLALLAWAPLAGVGAWVVAMAVEDLVAPMIGSSALGLSWVVAALVGWRLGWSGWVRVVARHPAAARRIHGLLAVPTVALVVFLAVRHGLPFHQLGALLAMVGG